MGTRIDLIAWTARGVFQHKCRVTRSRNAVWPQPKQLEVEPESCERAAIVSGHNWPSTAATQSPVLDYF
jgi:hypothetical protein